jgi:hypothetical protein
MSTTVIRLTNKTRNGRVVAKRVITRAYLPSKLELQAIFDNLKFWGGTAVGNFTSAYYHCSTETGVNSIQILHFGGSPVGFQGSIKTSSVRVRPVNDFMSRIVYQLRDYVNGCGWIYYIEDLGAGLYKYYYAYPVAYEVAKTWGTSGHLTGTIGFDAIGDGFSNTVKIVNKLNELGESDKAADYCYNLEI